MFKAIPLWLRVLVVVVLVGSFASWWWVPQWRTDKVLERVDAAVAQRDFETATTELRKLLERYPGQTEVALRLAEIRRAIEPAQAFTLYRELHQAGRLPPAAYPEAIIVGFEAGRSDEARAMLEAIEAEAPGMLQLAGVRAVVALAEGDFLEARNQLEETLALFPNWTTIRFLEGQLLRNSPSKVDQLRAKEDLLQVAESPEFDAVRAVFALVDSRNLAISPAQKAELLDKVIAHPWASARVRLLAYHNQWLLQTEERPAVIEAAVADLTPEHAVLVAEWLNAIGEFDRALALVPEGEFVKSDLGAFEQRFRALALGGRLDEAEELVRTAEVGENAVQRAARLFLVSLRPDNSEEALERWNEAYALARSEEDVGVQYFLGRSALRLGYLPGAMQAYNALFADPEFAAAAREEVWMEYFTVTLATGSIEAAHDVVQEAAERFPDSLALVNNQLYLELVTGMDWSEAYARFAAIAPPPAEVDDVNGVGSTWILSALLRDQPREALEYMDLIEAGNPDQPFNDSTKIIKALVLASNGRLEDAVSLSQQINRDNLLPVEWELLGTLRLEP